MAELVNGLNIPSKGLIIIGHRPGTGGSGFMWKIATELAKKESCEYIDFIHHRTSFRREKNALLKLNLKFSFLNYGYPMDFEAIRARNIFIDDLDTYTRSGNGICDFEKNGLIGFLKHYAGRKNVRLFIGLRLSRDIEIRGGDKRPILSDFHWCRMLVHYSAYIFSLYRPWMYGITQDEEGRDVENLVELEELFPERASYRLAFDKILSEFAHVSGYEL